MEIRRSLMCLLTLVAACAPAPDEDFREEELASELASAQAPPRGGLCSTTPVLVADIRPGATGSRPRELVPGHGALFFTAEDGVRGRELWKSTGPGGWGTSLVKDIRPGSATSNPRRLTLAAGKIFFTAEDGVHGRELWVSDGTAAGTVMVKDILPGPVGSAPDHLLAFGGVVYFAANDGANGTELWRSDGTPAGTFLVEDLYPGQSESGLPGSSSPRRLIQAGNAFYFVANIQETQLLWRSVGLPGATPLFSATDEAFLFSLTAVGPHLFFLADDGGSESSLWRGKGSRVKHVSFFPGLYPHDLTAVGGRLFFSAGLGEEGAPGHPRGEELWRSDGTPCGTELVKDLRPGPGSSSPGSLAAMKGWLYFAAEEDLHGRELWRSDGTAHGTHLLRELQPGAAGSSPQELTAVQGLLFFSAETSGRGREPWVSDGTAAGTVPLTEIAPGSASSEPKAFVRFGGNVFFTATDSARGEELWTLPLLLGRRCHEQ